MNPIGQMGNFCYVLNYDYMDDMDDDMNDDDDDDDGYSVF